jgi:hypothetical protein
MAGRAAALAEQFERAVAEFDLALAGLSDAQWRLACPDEGRAVGVLARHVAEGIPFQMAVFREIAAGRQPTTVSMTDLATMNAGHAAEWADCAKGETLALLRDNAAAAVAEVRGWDDTQLALAGKYIADLPEPWQVERWVERILVGHVQGHLQSIRAALGSA